MLSCLVMMSRFHPRTLDQNQGSDPEHSIWVSAHAGSGKTSVLVDRVLKLLLKGVEFKKIICLTYGNDAANEIKRRVTDVLAKWQSASDGDLKHDFQVLGIQDHNIRVQFARGLFSRALENFHNVRIKTMHSFCLSLIRQFSMECGVSPNFRTLDEFGAEYRKECMREAFRRLDYHSLSLVFSKIRNLDEFLEGVNANRYLVEKYLNSSDISTPSYNSWKSLPIQHWQGLSQDENRSLDSDALLAIENANHKDTSLEDCWAQYYKFFFTKKDSLRKSILKNEILRDLGSRVEDANKAIYRIKRRETTTAFLKFAREFLHLYEEKKAAANCLDFEDLVSKGSQLLKDFGNQWVGYKLDGMIEHVLVDEAQDISMDQWSVIESLTQEFFSQEFSSKPSGKTLMVVGDSKQSIYAFQGGGNFEKKRQQFISDDKMKNSSLSQSFRLPTMVLDLVNELVELKNSFVAPLRSQDPHRGASAVETGFAKENRGRVEIWIPTDGENQDEKREKVAKLVAEKINSILGKSYSEIGGDSSGVVKEEDILILFPKRNYLFKEVEKTLISHGLNFNAATRRDYAEEPMVKNMLLMMKMALNPNDDFNMASFLRSVQDLDAEYVENLCLSRGESSIWKALQEENEEVADQIKEMCLDVNRLSPYQFFYRWVWKFHTLRREPVLLSDFFDVCKQYQDLPGMTSGEFIEMTENSSKKKVSFNRNSGIRLMTVHNAKGLEAPVVFLPDCCQGFSFSKDKQGRILYGQKYPLLPGFKREEDSEWQAGEREATKEQSRLMYVAVTRAKLALYCGGIVPHHSVEHSWYEFLRKAAIDAGGKEVEGSLVLS